MSEDRAPDLLCRRCRHFTVTWVPAKPYGCRAFGFKGPELPCLTVFQVSGKPCQLFEAKPKSRFR